MSTIIKHPNAGIAFGLTCLAGFSSIIGASVVIFPSCVKLANKRALAAALGIAAGVMIYISFLEVFPLALKRFQKAGYPEKTAYTYATGSFFGGICIMVALDWMVKILTRWGSLQFCGCRRGASADEPGETEVQCDDSGEHVEGTELPYCMACTKDPASDLDRWQQMTLDEHGGAVVGAEGDMEAPQQQLRRYEPTSQRGIKPLRSALRKSRTTSTCDENDNRSDVAAVVAEEQEGEISVLPMGQAGGDDMNPGARSEASTIESTSEYKEHQKLGHVGWTTFLAISLHNFPEGLATFVATLEDPKVGSVLAAAVALHNIPEGLCVAMPVYFATKSRSKAFLWGCISGLTEPIAGICAWLFFANILTEDTFGFLYGIVAGMMVHVSVKELLPTAQRYDQKDTIVTYSFMFGMFVMGITLILFTVND